MIRVLIADDHRLVRQGIRLLLETVKDIEIVGEARDGHEAVEMASQLLPDVILMDADMPRLDGLQATQIISSSKLPTRVIILTMFANDAMQDKALQSGAHAYILKDCTREQLAEAIRNVLGPGSSSKAPADKS